MRFSDYEQFLRPIHLQGKRVTVTISRFEEIETHPRPGKKEKALCMYFKDKRLPLILSTPNRRFLMETISDDPNACIGVAVALEARPVRVAGVEKMVIRIFKAQPASQPEAPKEATQLSGVAAIGNGLYARTRTVN